MGEKSQKRAMFILNVQLAKLSSTADVSPHSLGKRLAPRKLVEKHYCLPVCPDIESEVIDIICFMVKEAAESHG